MIFALFESPKPCLASAGWVGLSSAIPGVGQTINGNPLEGLGYLVSTIYLMSSKSAVVKSMGFDLWMYNMYDAYRDARPSGSAFSDQNIFQNLSAPFYPPNFLDWRGATLVAAGAAAGAHQQYPALKKPELIAKYAFVGFGEEALFRGFVLPSFTDSFHSKGWGIVLSSAVFSVAHAATGDGSALAPSVLVVRWILGMWLAWQADSNKYDLRKNIFAHAWYDVLVDSTGSTNDIRPIMGVRFFLP